MMQILIWIECACKVIVSIEKIFRLLSSYNKVSHVSALPALQAAKKFCVEKEFSASKYNDKDIQIC